jgi:enamine deaminase RidA (YjgF/YER057c/UK114 family)
MPGPRKTRILLPASTGISGDNPHGSAVLMDLLAVIKDPDAILSVEQMTNPRQKDAVRYGSAFSRGCCLQTPWISTIQVSGTAAIDEKGKSLFPDDVRSQIESTLDNIEALLELSGASLADIAAATVFVKKPEDAVVFQEIAGKRGLDPFPGVTVVADICRSELLFEIDAEVVYHFNAESR